jgi:hypothetical protein
MAALIRSRNISLPLFSLFFYRSSTTTLSKSPPV